MGLASRFLRTVEGGYAHWCPACKELHRILVKAPSGPNWDFDGNVERPTFNPSIKITADYPADWGGPYCCHYHLHDGQLKYCGDCSHETKGQTVPLPPIPSWATGDAG